MSDFNLFEKTVGMPFLDDIFAPSFLFSLLAKKRMQLDLRAGNNILYFSDYLRPAEGWRVFRENGIARISPVPYEEFDEGGLAVINRLRETLHNQLPHWQPTLSLPVNILRLKGDILSSSTPWIPQHMFLSARALDDEDVLCECYIHELSHLWLTCYAEIFGIQVVSRRHHSLPSGTSNKDARGVLYAAFFSASLLYYINATNRLAQRADELTLYLKGCLSTLTEHQEELSPSGLQLLQRMIEFKHKLQRNL